MAMKRKHRRLIVLLACGAGLGSATALALSAFSSSVSFFVTPSQLAREEPGAGRTFRLGGLVEAGSLRKTTQDGSPAASFAVGYGKHRITVNYVGILPDLFREGQGIVAMGTLARDGTFRASEVLAKHDATYMPKDVADALKASGHWNPAEGPPPPASTWNTMAAKQTGG
jgi:cytochrome c-type biogenesis protein CcmE